ncbi:transposase [bacterium]|nr:transposase [bacterium]
MRGLTDHTCPACGAAAEWDPSTRTLRCPYCGTVAATETDPDSGAVREIPLAQALRDLPEEARGWQTERRSVRCQSCNAISVFEPDQVGRRCAFCGSPELVDYDEIRSPIRPQSLLPFTVDRVAVQDAVRTWWRKRWLAPGALKKRARVDEIDGMYLPYWTFDANTHARWTADSGTYYYTTRTVRGSDGKTRTKRVRHTRWRPAAGELSHFFDDELVPGSRGVRPGLLRGIEPFPTRDLVPYDTKYLSGFVVEHYQVVLLEAAQHARQSMERQLRDFCAARIPGDTHRNLRVDATWEGETFKHVLVPVWLLTYDFGPKSFQLVVNGASGRVAGEYPKSAWKIAGLVVAGLVVVAAVLLLARS